MSEMKKRGDGKDKEVGNRMKGEKEDNSLETAHPTLYVSRGIAMSNART